jgi:glycosyltransferase involved in cell wall biosynthesis
MIQGMDIPGTLRVPPEVSVIVPARNEETSLGSCLESLVGQRGAGFEIIVVDDGSTDRTREIAKSFAGIRIASSSELPPGWTGKNNALVAGAKEAAGKWFLFTDADTVHREDSLARALAEAKQHDAALLSYSPGQDVSGFWERSVMPVIFGELATTYQPSLVSDARSSAAAANGQYLLITREAYEAVGGHARVGSEILEDVALARMVKESGRKIYFRYAGEAVRTRMYRSFGQLREGWTKNLALLFPQPLHLAAVRLVEFVSIGTGAVLTITAARNSRGLALAMGSATAVLYGSFLHRIRKAHFSWRSNLLGILGLPVFAYLLWRSKLSHEKGTVRWKGRVYGRARGNERIRRHRL